MSFTPYKRRAGGEQECSYTHSYPQQFMEVNGQLYSPAALVLRKDTVTNWIGNWVGPRDGLNGFAEENISYPCRASKPISSHNTTTLCRLQIKLF